MLWLVPAFLLGTACVSIYGRLSFARTAVSNGVFEYAIAIAALPLVALALVCGARAILHLAAAFWPVKLGVFASGDTLELRLGPFRRRVFPVVKLDIRYPFEMIDDSDEGGFEQYLPQEEQLARLLPRIRHSVAKELINRTIMRYAAGDEAEIAAKLRPAIEHWKRQNNPNVQ